MYTSSSVEAATAAATAAKEVTNFRTAAAANAANGCLSWRPSWMPQKTSGTSQSRNCNYGRTVVAAIVPDHEHVPVVVAAALTSLLAVG